MLDDADLDAAVAAILEAAYLCAGQSCTAGERILVHRAVRGELVERLEAAVRYRSASVTLRPGDHDGPAQQRGVAAKTDDHVGQAVSAGARVAAGGARAAGYPDFVDWSPTVLDGVTPDMLIARRRRFGPVAPVVEVADDAEAMALDQRLARTACSRRCSPKTCAAGCASPRRCARAGSTSTPRPTTGRATCPSAVGPAA